MSIAGVIIAGGQSSRMGAEKALLEVGGQPIIARVAAVLAPYCEVVIINANGDPARFSDLGLPVVPDLIEGRASPLTGLHAGLTWAQAQGFDQVATVASDTPFLPADLVPRLSRAATDHVAAVARSGGQGHFTTGLWRAALAPLIEDFLVRRGEKQAGRFVEMIDAAFADWPAAPIDPFFNINTPEDLADAERLATEAGT